MEKKILNFLPWLLVLILIGYYFFSGGSHLNKAKSEIEDAKLKIEDSQKKINESILKLDSIADTLRTFKLRSDALYLDFINASNRLNKNINDFKPALDKFNKTLTNRIEEEDRAYKPIVPINY